MKTLQIVLICIATLLMAPVDAANITEYTQVKDHENGVFSVKMKSPTVMYYFVDVNTELCFVGNNDSFLAIECSSLAKRKEWEQIITWVRASDSS